MAVTKKRVSRAKRGMRNAGKRIKLPSMVRCTCGSWKINHNLCDSCNMYKGKQVA